VLEVTLRVDQSTAPGGGRPLSLHRRLPDRPSSESHGIRVMARLSCQTTVVGWENTPCRGQEASQRALRPPALKLVIVSIRCDHL
jgi:hypothetical protein